MRTCLLLAVCGCGSLAHAQQPAKAVRTASFVQAAEKFSSALDRTLGNSKPQYSLPVSPAGDVTRAFVLQYLDKTLDHFAPQFKSHPRPVKFDESKLKGGVAPTALSSAERLVRMGFVPPFSPLVTAKSDNLTPEQLGDALGYFYSRMCYLVHKPIPKFTPNLEPTGG